MNEIKSYILEFIWLEKEVSDFEQWLYNQNSIKFIKLIGEENYMELVGYDYQGIIFNQIKELLKSVLPPKVIKEFEIEFEKRKSSNVIRAKCLKTKALNYNDSNVRNWRLEVGGIYEIIEVNLGLQSGNHKALVRYLDKNNHFYPSGYVPADLFDIDFDKIPNSYFQIKNDISEIIIMPKEQIEGNYKPSKYSFWEDFYDGDEKAINTYHETIKKLGLRNVW